MEEFPNVLIVPLQEETPEDIVEDYTEIIKYNLDHGIPIEEILNDFFSDVERWSYKQFHINQAKACLQELEDLHKLETEFDEDSEYDF